MSVYSCTTHNNVSVYILRLDFLSDSYILSLFFVCGISLINWPCILLFAYLINLSFSHVLLNVFTNSKHLTTPESILEALAIRFCCLYTIQSYFPHFWQFSHPMKVFLMHNSKSSEEKLFPCKSPLSTLTSPKYSHDDASSSVQSLILTIESLPHPQLAQYVKTFFSPALQYSVKFFYSLSLP